MILSIREYQQGDFRGFNFLLSSLAPQTVKTQSDSANSSFQEALLAVHGNNEATLPFPSFDQASCELKVAKYRAEKKIKDRLLPQPRYFCICFFMSMRSVYVNIPSWMRIYFLKTSGELFTPTNLGDPTAPNAEEWKAHPLDKDIAGLGLSIFESPDKPIEDWSRLQSIPKHGTMLRVSQFLETPRYGDDGTNYMPIWSLNLNS
jgi:hypothetical protein